MPVKSRESTAVVEAKRSTRRPKSVVPALNLAANENPGVTEMLKQIKVRGDQLSAEIKQLLVRLG